MLERYVPDLALDSLNEIREFRNRMNRLFGDFFTREVSGRGEEFPAVDLLEEKDKYVLTMEIPGVSKEDVNLSVQDGMLIIKGERKRTELPEGARWLRNEMFSGQFSRSIILPGQVDTEKISAEYRDGILRIEMAKKEEAKPKEIEIQVK